MSSASRARVQQLSEQLVVPRQDPGMFEDIPRIPTLAGDSVGLYVTFFFSILFRYLVLYSVETIEMRMF